MSFEYGVEGDEGEKHKDAPNGEGYFPGAEVFNAFPGISNRAANNVQAYAEVGDSEEGLTYRAEEPKEDEGVEVELEENEEAARHDE